MIGTTISHYRILEQIGRGGMGVVYLAEDTTLRRKVALKFLPAEAAADAERLRRFRREAMAVAALNHPSIVTIHSLEEVEGTPFIVMERIQGQTLSSMIPAGGLSVDRFLELAEPIADAVAAAHRKGITHRDLKPANVMVTAEGRVKVLDFGLVKLLEPLNKPDPEVTESMTMGAHFLGTVAYASPEQVEGRDVDARSDVFSLGVMFHEMLTGVRPFGGASNIAILSAIMKDPPPSLLESRPDLPADLVGLVDKSLSKDRDERYDTASGQRDTLARVRKGVASGTATSTGRIEPIPVPAPKPRSLPLRQVVLGALVVALVAAGGFAWTWIGNRSEAVQAASGIGAIESLAVLPFRNLSGDPDQEYFVDGMTESLISELGRLGTHRKITARSSVMRYKGVAKPLPEIAAELGVDGIVESSVLHAGNRVRITATLYHGPSESLLWTNSYEKDAGDILALQREVAMAIAREVTGEVGSPGARGFAGVRRVDPEVHTIYLRGRYQLNKRTPDSLRKALEFFDKALAIDSHYAPAYGGKAETYVLLGSFGFGVMSPLESIPLAKQSALQALDIEEDLTEARVALALSLTQEWSWSEAEAHFRRAIELNPSDALARHQYALFLTAMGRHPEAIAQITEARSLDPVSLIINQAVAMTHYFAGDYDRAIADSRAALEDEPAFWVSHLLLGNAYSQKGEYALAEEHLAKAKQIVGDHAYVLGARAMNSIRWGKSSEAREALADLQVRARSQYVPPSLMAKLHLALGELDAGFAWLQRAHAERDPSLSFLEVDPDYAPFRAEPRFESVLAMIGLR